MNATKSRSKNSVRRAKWDKYVASMKYAKYVLFHPFDGFWDLTHEKRGSFAAATTFLVLFLLGRPLLGKLDRIKTKYGMEE